LRQSAAQTITLQSLFALATSYADFNASVPAFTVFEKSQVNICSGKSQAVAITPELDFSRYGAGR
jgi:hypothetical protein